MSNAIRFFVKATGANAPSELDYFIRDDGTVWRNNEQTCESQCAVVGFDDFILPCPEIGWEVVTSSSALRPAAQPVGEPVAWQATLEGGVVVHGAHRDALSEAVEAMGGRVEAMRPLVFGDTTPHPSPERVPMTLEQRDEVFRKAEARMVYDINLSWRHAVVEETEAHHDITTPKTDK